MELVTLPANWRDAVVVGECLERGEVAANVRIGFGKRGGRRQKLCLPLIFGTCSLVAAADHKTVFSSTVWFNH